MKAARATPTDPGTWGAAPARQPMSDTAAALYARRIENCQDLTDEIDRNLAENARDWRAHVRRVKYGFSGTDARVAVPRPQRIDED